MDLGSIKPRPSRKKFGISFIYEWRILLLLGAMAVHSLGTCQDITDGLFAKYCLDGNAEEIFGNFSGKLYGGVPATDRFGRPGHAVELDGVNDFIQLPSDTWIDGDFTFSGWVKLDEIGWFARLFCFGNGIDKHNVFLSTSDGSNGRLHFTTHNCVSGSARKRVESSTKLPLNEWLHIAVTLDNDLVSVYKNGAFWYSAVTPILPCKEVKDSAFFGKSNYPADDYLKGTIDDYRFYDRALSSEEILTLYNLPPEDCCQAVSHKSIRRDTLVCERTSVRLRTSEEGDRYSWQDGSSTISFLAKYPGMYWVDVLGGCQITRDSIQVQWQPCEIIIPNFWCSVFVPNVFSPNEDQLNDGFGPTLIDCSDSAYLFRIYNMWGEKIFETQNPYEAWNGYYQNGKVQLGVYFYTLAYSVNRRMKYRDGKFLLVK